MEKFYAISWFTNGASYIRFLEHGAFIAIVSGMQHMPEQHIPRDQ